MKAVKSHEKVIAAVTAEDNQIAILEGRIRQLEDTVYSLQEKDGREWDHRSNRISASMGIDPDQAAELDHTVKFWRWQYDTVSEVLQKIEQAPVKLREKIYMTAIMMLNSQGGGGGPSMGVFPGGDFVKFIMDQMKGGGR